MIVIAPLWGGCRSSIFAGGIGDDVKTEQPDLFETAIEIIKKYETIHKPRHWPFVGYGHKVLPGEKFSRKKTLSESEADALLRKDLTKLCAMYRGFGADSLILATLAYNIGHGAVNRSSIVSRLKEGDRDIHDTYVAYCRYRGKVHAGIQRRRIEEFENLYVVEPEEAEAAPPLLMRPFVAQVRRDGRQRLFATVTDRQHHLHFLEMEEHQKTI